MQNYKIEISGNNLIKSFAILAGIILVMHFGASLLLPIFVAAIIGTLLNVPISLLQKWGTPKWLAMLISLVSMLIVAVLLFWLIFSQMSLIAEDWEKIQQKGMEKLTAFTQWSKDYLGINYQNYIGDGQELFNKAKDLLTYFLSSFSNMLSQGLITFIYIVLFLMQKHHFIGFFMRLTTKEVAMNKILTESAGIITSYLSGKGKIMLFLFGIYYAGFTLGSVPYALFLALFAALFSIIPYIGNFIGGGIAVILSYLFAGGSSALFVIAVISATQLIENYILTPWIIGDEINLNPFVTIFAVLLFSAIWGVAGAIFALPFAGIIKVILDHTKGLEAYAYLMKKQE